MEPCVEGVVALRRAGVRVSIGTPQYDFIDGESAGLKKVKPITLERLQAVLGKFCFHRVSLLGDQDETAGRYQTGGCESNNV